MIQDIYKNLVLVCHCVVNNSKLCLVIVLQTVNERMYCTFVCGATATLGLRPHHCWGLTLILLTWKIWCTPNNASRWQIGINSAFKGLISHTIRHTHTHTNKHTHTHTHTSRTPLNERSATYTTHSKHKRRTTMPSAGFEPAISAIKRPLGFTCTVLYCIVLYRTVP
jgi:hypothetical protein